MTPDALHSIASQVEREWGVEGYWFEKVEPYSTDVGGGALGHVVARDGSRFTVGADRWGNALESARK